ncbi:BREX-1 system phosphatase PglZ type A [Comamonas resistens]|uniref:BREX-1 system phosphatase PglZ type A n=1 Tax=Comamonas resistens TaxID=3046670 RepID=UPI0039BD2FCE
MNNERIAQALGQLFDKQRIVFWYDTQQEFAAEFAALDLPGVEKIALANNEFGVKYRVLRGQPTQKFLLFRAGPQPEHLHNWLLDVQLASGAVFRTDQVALWLAELGLGPQCYALLQEHVAFFEAAKRRDTFKALLTPDDDTPALRLKMLAVCAGSAPRLDEMLEALLAELAEGGDARSKLLQRCGLDKYFWQLVQRSFGYGSSQPGLQDFAIELFKSCFFSEVDADFKPSLSQEAKVFIRRWKDSRTHAQAFEVLSAQCAGILQIEERLQILDYRTLMAVDEFEVIDRKILSELVREVAARTVAAQELEGWVLQRRRGHWFARYADVYLALEHAAQFMHQLELTPLEMESLADGIHKYAATWFALDQHYRKFVHHARASGQASLLQTLSQQVENFYTNNYLSRLNVRWQPFVDGCQQWRVDGVLQQRHFFAERVQPHLQRKGKLCVLISDALRYEVGQELQRLIRQENRFDAELAPMLASLPSYTQLGMAALLPHQRLELAEDGSGDVLADGISAKGSDNRARILAQAVPASTVVLAKDVLTMGKEESRALVREHEVVYVYHNLIDKVGDTRDTEERVFAAAQDTLGELLLLIKKLVNANASHVLVTADHGFIYQNQPLQESDFVSAEPEGASILYRDRRFVLGRGLCEQSSFKTWQPEQLGLGGSLQVQMPKSIQRLRLQGSGSRFVHGGATLQEVVIPLISVHKKRQSDVGKVEVEVIGGGGKAITTGQLGVLLYQTEPVTEKRQPRLLRVGLYTLAGEAISDTHELQFDRDSSNPRERELTVRLILSRKADSLNNQEVELRLEEAVEGTSHHSRYQTLRYTIRRAITGDFDF